MCMQQKNEPITNGSPDALMAVVRGETIQWNNFWEHKCMISIHKGSKLWISHTLECCLPETNMSHAIINFCSYIKLDFEQRYCHNNICIIAVMFLWLHAVKFNKTTTTTPRLQMHLHESHKTVQASSKDVQQFENYWEIK